MKKASSGGSKGYSHKMDAMTTMKKMSSGGSKGYSLDAKGISVKRGVGTADFKSAGANVKRPGADKIDAKRG